MRDNKKLLIALCAVLLVCVGLLAAAVLFRGRPEDTQVTEEGYRVVYSADVADITAFTLRGTEDTKSFSYTDSGWVYNGLTDFPLDPDFMHYALEYLSLVDAVQVVAEGVEDLSPYGLSEPQMSFSVTAGEERTFLIGNYNSYNGYYYFCPSGSDTVFMVDADLPLLCACEERDLITAGSLPDNFTDGTVKRVSVDGTDYTAGALLDEVHGITLSDYEKYKAEEDDLAGAVKMDIYYSAATEDAYGTSLYDIELNVRARGEYLIFTYGDDPILYRIKKTDFPEMCNIIE